ncbi:MAG: hypothetical protein CNCCGFBP_00205 [Fimbriimonadaceae bacterium]|nr:hypothetical protein [Fimbriimonadaceae bacterium]
MRAITIRLTTRQFKHLESGGWSQSDNLTKTCASPRSYGGKIRKLIDDDIRRCELPDEVAMTQCIERLTAELETLKEFLESRR